MIEKIVIQKLTIAGKKYEYPDTTALVGKINELIDAVNVLQLAKDAMFNAIRDIQNRITALEDPTYHEEAQDMYDNAILDALKDKQVDVVVEPADPYAEQRKWIGKLCKFYDYDDEEKWFSVLENIDKNSPYPYCASGDWWYKHCEPVKPDDDIIYKGGDNE